MMIQGGKIEAGIVDVKTTNHRGFSPEEVAERCLSKIISVSDTASPVIKEQAEAFQNHIRSVLVFYMKEMVQSDRTTTFNALCEAGHKDLAEIIRRI
jgi:hypothetical protein